MGKTMLGPSFGFVMVVAGHLQCLRSSSGVEIGIWRLAPLWVSR